ncbi:MAG: hypothetical protein SGARI_001922 [Bacillariaceae sp.]
MYTSGGYSNLTAMDYAPEAIERCREMLEAADTETSSIRLAVADARDLSSVFSDEEFDAVFEKGTLDAIFLSGGQDKKLALQNMNQAISELDSFDQLPEQWECLVDKDDLYTSEDGFTSNNIDGTLLVWRKR